jgi:hypothetical protein
MGERKGAYRDLAGKSEGKRTLRSPRHRLEDSIKLNFKKWEGE